MTVCKGEMGLRQQLVLYHVYYNSITISICPMPAYAGLYHSPCRPMGWARPSAGGLGRRRERLY
jgi:hypothetical protein